MKLGQRVSQERFRHSRELQARACESVLLSAVIIAQQVPELEHLVDDLARLHGDAGAARRQIEASPADAETGTAA